MKCPFATLYHEYESDSVLKSTTAGTLDKTKFSNLKMLGLDPQSWCDPNFYFLTFLLDISYDMKNKNFNTKQLRF